MRKLVVSMNITLDGFMAGPAAALDWHFRYWTEEMADHNAEQLSRADTILLGRITYQAMSSYWPLVSSDPCFPRSDIAFADMMNNYQKIVCSRSTKNTSWSNSKIIANNVKREISKLKQLPGKDIIVYGSRQLLKALQKAGLVDEYVLYLHPVLLGRGIRLFNEPGQIQLFELIENKQLDSGVNVLHYRARF